MASIWKGMLKGLPPDAPRLGVKGTLRAWWRACRPPFLIVDLIPVTLALGLAHRENGEWPLGLFWCILFGCLCLHTVANLANDLFDHLLGTDTEDTIGGSRVIQNKWISPRQLALVIAALLLLSAGLGGWLITQSGLDWLWWLLGLALFSAVFYVAPPIRYGYHGYGELAVGVNMGLVMVTGIHALLLGRFAPQSLAFGLVVGVMVAGILYYQSLPEIESDAAAGKRTLAVRLGKSRAELVYRIWWPLVWVLLGQLWALGAVGWPVLFALLGLPLHLLACWRIARARDWLELDQYGGLVRGLYLVSGLALVAGVFTA